MVGSTSNLKLPPARRCTNYQEFLMSAISTRRAKLANVKTDLAKKYEHKAKTLKSKKAQAKARRRAAGYLHEADVLTKS